MSETPKISQFEANDETETAALLSDLSDRSISALDVLTRSAPPMVPGERPNRRFQRSRGRPAVQSRRVYVHLLAQPAVEFEDGTRMTVAIQRLLKDGETAEAFDPNADDAQFTTYFRHESENEGRIDRIGEWAIFIDREKDPDGPVYLAHKDDNTPGSTAVGGPDIAESPMLPMVQKSVDELELQRSQYLDFVAGELTS